MIPRTIAFNCGANTIRTLTALRAKHAEGSNAAWGVDGMTGTLEDMERLGVLEPMAVKLQGGHCSIDNILYVFGLILPSFDPLTHASLRKAELCHSLGMLFGLAGNRNATKRK